MVYSGMWGEYKPPASLSLTGLTLPAQFLSRLWEPGNRNLEDSTQLVWFANVPSLS